MLPDFSISFIDNVVFYKYLLFYIYSYVIIFYCAVLLISDFHFPLHCPVTSSDLELSYTDNWIKIAGTGFMRAV